MPRAGWFGLGRPLLIAQRRSGRESSGCRERPEPGERASVLAAASSPAVAPTTASTTRMIASAVRIATDACSATSCCSDLGDGRHLVGLLQRCDQQDNPLWIVRRTEIDLNGATATIGRSDTVPATSDQDPARTTAGQISCGDLTMERDGLWAPY
jgi:hypothetical protein